MQTSRQQFIKYLETQQWSAAATVSVNAMKSGGFNEINWYLDQLMTVCNRWRVMRMVKTWLDHDVELVPAGSAFERFYQGYNSSVMGLIADRCHTDLQRQRREQFRKLYFQAYPVEDPLAHWIKQGKILVDNLDD